MDPILDEKNETNSAGRPQRHFAFFSDDPRQDLRLRRFLMAAATSLLVILGLLLAASIGLLPMQVAIHGSGAIASLAVVFYLLLRSGLNLRFSDPSLTTEQIAAATALLAFIMYHSPQSGGVLIILYIVPLMFGVLQLRTARLLSVAAITFAMHALVVWFWYLDRGTPTLKTGIAQLAVLAVVLPWFAFMGGYVNRLRVRLSDTNQSLADAVNRIEQIANYDMLTGVFNRRYLLETLEREQSRSKRMNTPLSLCMIDIDHFKSVNDNYGHATGDLILKHFAMQASKGMRGSDVFGRYGGEEFLLVLPDTDLKGALVVAERVRARIEASVCPDVPEELRITVTIGVASLDPGESVSALIERADVALYEGKRAGRNRATPSESVSAKPALESQA
ncbi:MAG: GGDEF domain-containing protein [Pseudomonadota bacterium]